VSRNALRVAAVNTVGGSLLWVGKIAVAALCGGFAFLMCDLPMYVDADRATALSSPLFPVLFSAVFAYFIAAVFMNVSADVNIQETLLALGSQSLSI
jgi:hypothetical protein